MKRRFRFVAVSFLSGFLAWSLGGESKAMGGKAVSSNTAREINAERNLYRERFGKDWKAPMFPTGPKDQIRLAKEWVPYADCIVIGRVKKTESHPEGPYHTWVTIEVEKYLKGELEQNEIVVKVISGETVCISTEPVFALNEKLLVFLTTISSRLYRFCYRRSEEVARGSLPTHPYPTYTNRTKCIGYFEPMGKKLKFEIVGNRVKYGRNNITVQGITTNAGVEIGDLNSFTKELLSVIVEDEKCKERKER
jgi:hypothetical protein